MLVIESAALTDVGQKRSKNEDAYLVDDAIRLYIVADGMGGHQAGEVASKMVVDAMRSYVKRFHEQEVVEELEDGDRNLSKEANRLLAGIRLANRAVYDMSEKNQSLKGMGSTVSTVYMLEDQTFVAANVGDSPIYLVHEGQIERLSVPHTLMEEHAALNPDVEMPDSPFKHMLTRGMGVEPSVEPDVSQSLLFRGDVVIICSDGLSNKVSPEEIRDISMTHSADKACRKLVELANARGGEDNITVLILKEKSGQLSTRNLASLFARVKEKFRKRTAK